MSKKKALYAKLSPTVQVALALILFIVATILSRPVGFSQLEVEIFNLVYGLPRELYLFFYIITQFGSIYVLAALLIFYLIKQHYHIVLRLLLTGTLAYLVAGFAKSLWGRARPHELLTNTITLDYFQGPGFPSGHVALAVALALTIGHYLPRKYHWIPMVWIIGVALSRMYLGVHAPLDIVAGFALGWFAYAIFRHVRIYDVVRKKKSKESSTSSKLRKTSN